MRFGFGRIARGRVRASPGRPRPLRARGTLPASIRADSARADRASAAASTEALRSIDAPRSRITVGCPCTRGSRIAAAEIVARCPRSRFRVLVDPIREFVPTPDSDGSALPCSPRHQHVAVGEWSRAPRHLLVSSLASGSNESRLQVRIPAEHAEHDLAASPGRISSARLAWKGFRTRVSARGDARERFAAFGHLHSRGCSESGCRPNPETTSPGSLRAPQDRLDLSRWLVIGPTSAVNSPNGPSSTRAVVSMTPSAHRRAPAAQHSAASARPRSARRAVHPRYPLVARLTQRADAAR